VSDYEELRSGHLEAFMGHLPEHLERLVWPADRLFEERTSRLRAVLRTATTRSAWHRTRLGDLDPDRVDESDLTRMPVMTKHDLMTHWDDIVTVDGVTLERTEAHLSAIASDAYFAGSHHAVASGGSSGRRGVFVYDWEGWLLCYLGFVRHTFRERMRDPESAAVPTVAGVVAADKPTHFTSAMAQTFSSPLVQIHRFPVTLPLADIVTGLNRVEPTQLSGYSSILGVLAREARAGRLRIAPQTIMATSEPLLPEIRAQVEDVWHCPVGNWWGTSEGGPTGVSCARAEGMHLPDDLLIVELVDAAGRPVPPGVRSAKVLLTNLMNHALPLIRYEVTDEVTLVDEPCPCGSTHRRVADIQGRQDDAFIYAGDVYVHPITFRSPLGRERGIVEYQVRQAPRGADVSIRCDGPVDVAGVRARMEQELGRLGLREPVVTVTVAEELVREASGKLKRFFPLASAAGATGG
jgi:phenylacetate-coenzyme A ligase PaaK-like adenylate-forming protein